MKKGEEEEPKSEDIGRVGVLELDNVRRRLRKQRIVLLSSSVNFDMAKEAVEDFELLGIENKKPVRVILASLGGDAFAGYTIMRAIQKAQRRGIKVTGDVQGVAMSMAFFILQCCDERVMGRLCTLMCHGVTTFTIGDMKDLDAERKLMHKFQHDISVLIAKRNTSKDEKYHEAGYWHAILEDNTPQFYDSKESKEMGLIDKVE